MWLIWLLPLGGLLTVGLYRVLRLRDNRGTNEIIDAILNHEPVKPMVAPAIFLTTTTTHLLGGSAGREGAALQLGGSMGSWVAKWLKLDDNDRTVLIMSGMSAVFAGLFGTPLTACIFVLEFITVGRIFTPALVPCYLAALVASLGAQVLGIYPETFPLTTAVTFNISGTFRYMLLAVLVSLVGIAMCWIFHKAEHLAVHHIPNPWLRIALGGAVIAGLTALVGDHRYNGAGMDMALSAVGGQADWYDFLMKMLFTAVTLAAGFKGGEIVPTFCIGATFGCLLGALLGLDPGISAALGLVGLFCCATNSPLAAIALSVEMFGSTNLYLFGLVCVICFLLSGNGGLYGSQRMQFDKASTMEGRAK
jgi:H+/Cl- antiporter ClcA